MQKVADISMFENLQTDANQNMGVDCEMNVFNGVSNDLKSLGDSVVVAYARCGNADNFFDDLMKAYMKYGHLRDVVSTHSDMLSAIRRGFRDKCTSYLVEGFWNKYEEYRQYNPYGLSRFAPADLYEAFEQLN